MSTTYQPVPTTPIRGRPFVGAAMLLTLALASATVTAQPAAVATPENDTDRAIAAAHANYDSNHWPQAFAAFAALADQGHPGAARIALQMARHGPQLYGVAFDVDAERQARWVRVAACLDVAGRAGCMLAQRRP